MSRRALLALAATALVVAVLLAVSGGFRFTVGGLRVSIRSPLVASLVALVAGSVWSWLASRSGTVARDLDDGWQFFERFAWTIAIVIAAASAGAAVAFGTYSSAGADASGYLSQAAMWADGRLRLADALSRIPNWPTDPGTTVPLGWNASLEPGWQVPTYGPGLPLLMTMPSALEGTIAASLVIAVCAAVAVLATAGLARHLAGGPAAIVAALSLATAPVFLHQSFQPMSDLPVTAAWMVTWWLISTADGRRPAVARRTSSELWRGHAEAAFGREGGQSADGTGRIVAGGVAAAIAVLIRPNLAPLAIVPLSFVMVTATRTRRIANSAAFAVPVAIAGVVLAWLQWRWYGSALRSGYGTVEELYSLANIPQNATRYLDWFVSTSPLLFFALAGGWIKRSPLAWSLVTFALLNIAAYLTYFVFEDWTYLRFLLAALAVAAVFLGIALAEALARLDPPMRAVVFFVIVIGIGGLGLWRARTLDTFQVAEAHRRVREIDAYLATALPDRAVVIAGEQSGAVRLDTGHDIVRWEATSRDDVVRALAALDADRREVWMLLDVWEEPLVRAKYAGVDAISLDWPPVVDAGDTHRTRAWRLSDRQRYLAGERIVVDRLR